MRRLRGLAIALALLSVGWGAPLEAQPPEAVLRPASTLREADLEAALGRYAGEPEVGVLVAAAIRLAGASPERARRFARRSRLAGWLPAVRLGARRGRARDESASQSGSGDRTNLSADEDLTLDASLSFRFDRLAYGEDEVSWLREERALSSLRAEVARAVIALYFERRRLQLERDLMGLFEAPRELRIDEIEALLDALTGGALRGRGGGGAQAGERGGRR